MDGKGGKMPVVMAIAAHPDDIEFMMGGTLLLLKEAGCEIHYFNIANGNRGSREYDSDETIRVRGAEAIRAAEILGAVHHPSLCNDLEVFYTFEKLQKVSAIIRKVRPTIVLTQSPFDYMEDHINASRLAVAGAFTRGMANMESIPSQTIYDNDVVVYHALPYGLRGPLRQRVVPEGVVDTSSVQEVKMRALAAHRSQQNWLEVSQGHNSYLAAMEGMSAEVGALSGAFRLGEGWQRHSHLGLGNEQADPLREILEEKYWLNPDY